mmetsp:Transcript_90/g.209  ORF Transcript_90/g.209 Transcript_90/m.209 type:complete len:639 (-) Transcript_90:82-1998(-)
MNKVWAPKTRATSPSSTKAAENAAYFASSEVVVAEAGTQATATAEPMKYIVLTGGTVSGLGKGTAIASIGVVLKSHGLRVTAIKVDPHLNVDAGTVSPNLHGEVYVLDDGGQVDLDLGTYERFLDVTLMSGHNITSGKLFEQVIQRERTGQYLGKSVRMVPHVTDAFNDWIVDMARTCVDGSSQSPQVCLIELGGTVGDVECTVYLEALQQLAFQVGRENFCTAHMCLVPVMGSLVEQKTKPCQQSVRLLREAGLTPDFLLCRSEQPLEEEARRRLSMLCQVRTEHIVSLHDVSNIYRVPLLLAEQEVGANICRHFGLACAIPVISPSIRLQEQARYVLGEAREKRLGDWRMLADRLDTCIEEVVVAIVGKHSGTLDAYVSVVTALKHAGVEAGLHVSVDLIESQDLEPNTQRIDPKRYDAAWWKLRSAGAVVVPGGFGDRNIEGKVTVASHCRESQTPFLGIGAGMQAAVIEFGRSELLWTGANSTEFDEGTRHPVVTFMPEVTASTTGGTLRLGTRVTTLKTDMDSLARKLYDERPTISERHRRRYEVNLTMQGALEARGLCFTAHGDRGQRLEMCELTGHPFFVGCQFHPELLSRPARPSPPILGLVLAAAKRLERRLGDGNGCLCVGAGFERII